MSTTTASDRSHAPYAEPDEYIDYQLRKTQGSIKRNDMLTAGAVAVTIVIGYVLLFVLCDHWLFDGGASPLFRWIMLLPMLGIVGWLVGAKIAWPALKNVSGLFAAKTLETSAPEFRSSLLSLIDLKRAERSVSPMILATMEKRAAVTLAKFNVDDAIDKQPLLRTLYVLFGIVAALCAYSIFSPKKLGPSVLRAIVPFTNVTPATQTEIVEVKPGDAKLRAGSILPVSVQVRGEIPTQVTLKFTTSDRRFVDEPVPLGATTDPNLFEGTLGNDEHGLLQSFSYHVVAGDARSPEYRVEIITPPSATVTEVRYDYPEYTELDPRTQMGGAIDVWERTAATITAVTNIPVKRAEFELADTEDFASAYPGSTVKITDGKKLSIAWRADPRQADGKFPKFYRVKVWDDEGNPDPKPAVYPINVRIDQPPQVVLIDPTTNLEVPANATIPLVVAARDQDFKLRTVSLKIARDENDITDEELFNGSQQEVGPLKHDFALEPLRLKTGDKLRIWVEAQDNRLPTHNLAKTTTLEITIKDKVSKEEAKQQLEQEKKDQQKRLDEASQKNNEQANDRSEQRPADTDNSPDQTEQKPNETQQAKDDRDAQQDDKTQQKGTQPGDDKNQTQDGGNSKSQKPSDGKSKDSGSNGNADQQKPGDKNDSSNGQSGRQSLKNDGTQDQEALEKIAQNEKRRGRLPKNNEQQNSLPSTQREPQENSESESADKPMPNGSTKPNSDENASPNDGNKPPKADGTNSKKPNGQPANEGDETNPKDNSSTKPADKGNEQPGTNDSKSPQKNADNQGNPKANGNDQKPMPEKTPGEKNNSANPDNKSTDGKQSGNDKPDAKPNAQQSGGNEKSGSDQKQSQPNGNEKSDKTQQKPNGLGKPENNDKQRSPDGAKSDKPSDSGKPSAGDKSANSKDGSPAPDSQDGKPDRDQPGSKKSDDTPSNDPAGQDSKQKNSTEQGKQAGSKKSDSGQSGDKTEDQASEKGDASKKPRRGSQGDKANESNDDSKPSSDQPGSEKKSASSKPGQSNKQGEKSDSGQSKGGSQKSDKAGQESGDQSGHQKSSGQSGSGQSSGDAAGQPGSGKPGSQGKPSGKPGAAPGDGAANQPGQPSDNQSSSSSGSSSDATEEANEEFTKEAANLVLKRLKNELERGDVDQELLNELGWTPEQMKKFVERNLSQLEDKPDDNSPAAQARRRQFEEMLKNLNLTSKTQRRDDSNKDKQNGEAIGTSRRQAPPEYREWIEQYSKSVSKKKPAEKK